MNARGPPSQCGGTDQALAKPAQHLDQAAGATMNARGPPRMSAWQSAGLTTTAPTVVPGTIRARRTCPSPSGAWASRSRLPQWVGRREESISVLHDVNTRTGSLSVLWTTVGAYGGQHGRERLYQGPRGRGH